MKEFINIPDDIEIIELFGTYNNRVKYLKNKFDVEISYLNNRIVIVGNKKNNIERVKSILKEIIDITSNGHLLDWTEFQYITSLYENNKNTIQKNESKSYKSVVNTTVSGMRVQAKTHGQSLYINTMKKNDIVFCIGPAGTGKTYLAVAMAVEFLKTGQIQRIILTRPAVEAGEKLGFLPGTLYEKVDPYLRPLYDSLMDFMPADRIVEYKEKGIIEVVPLAYMRGRTLNNAYIILDEAQNTTYYQMKMFLTRIGFNSKAVITGDITQIDLENKKDSGLLAVQKILKNINGISFIELTENDVVRNPLVKEIIKAYDNFEKIKVKKNEKI
ncbi:DEAD/DEAH box helicase [Marinitoga sp. 1135]|uniref:PhoH family protein n=1 Tax=unclassified Marinitoga TaxID=2640159 RepID=UPI0009503BC1|nr:DEAD/DEAH box helicase [Marinitoga sp. 1137]NUU94727.1 DEAD/DEAH box helicase [Marinitoga sp. 1135]NUU96656.1 DEAD/DEAH box helicase [Marinitoga sp. 1138]